MSFIRNRSSPAATTARFAMPLSEKKILSPVSRTAAGLRALRGSFVARGFWGRDKLEITLSRARSPRLRLIDFFRRPASRPCSPFSAWDVGDRDRENRDGALERLGTKKPRRERGKRPPLDATRLRHTKVGRYRADTTRVDDHDNHDKMGTKRHTPGKRRKKRGPIGRRSRRSLGRL